jgi:hypothetical protein
MVRSNVIWSERPAAEVGVKGVSTRPAVVMAHSPSRTLPSLDEVLRTFHQQASLANTLYDRIKYVIIVKEIKEVG